MKSAAKPAWPASRTSNSWGKDTYLKTVVSAPYNGSAGKSDTLNVSEGYRRTEVEQTRFGNSALRVEVAGYRNLLSDYETIIKGGTITCRFEPDAINVRNNHVRVCVYTPDLEKVTLHGSGEIMVLGNGDLGLTGTEINGSGDISISQPEASQRRIRNQRFGKNQGAQCGRRECPRRDQRFRRY